MNQVINAVYYVDAGDLDLNCIAIRPTLQSERIYWEDTSTHGKTMRVSNQSIKNIQLSLGINPYEVKIEGLNGEKVVLRYLTLQLFNEKVKDLVAGQPTFKSTEDLQEFYLEMNFESYGS